jgi:hypothetical protein
MIEIGAPGWPSDGNVRDQIAKLVGSIRSRTEPLDEAERISLVSGLICEVAELEGVSASEIALRAAESYLLARFWNVQ